MKIPDGLASSFTQRGWWWLPGKEEHKVSGSLAFSPDGGATIRLLGTLFGPPMISTDGEAPIVLGADEEGTPLTLLNCLQTSLRVSSGAAGAPATSELDARFVLVGAHVESESQVAFDRAYVSYWGLDQWAARSGFAIRLNRDKGATVRYSPPTRRRLGRASGTTIYLETGHTLPAFTPVLTEATIRQQSALRLQFDKRLGIEDVLERIFQVANFLSLAVGEPVYPLKINLQTPRIVDDFSGKRYRRSVPLLFGLSGIKDLGDPPLPMLMNFSLPKVEDDIEGVVSRWIELAPLLQPVWDLFFGAMYAETMYLQFKFLSLAYSLESFHRRCRQSATDESNELRLSQILESAPEQHREWLERKLQYSGGPTLRKRVEALLSEFGALGEVFAAPRDSFVSQLVLARNNLTHYDAKDGDEMDPTDLYRLTQRTQGLVAICLLSETGFSHEQIQLMVHGESRFFKRILYSIAQEAH